MLRRINILNTEIESLYTQRAYILSMHTTNKERGGGEGKDERNCIPQCCAYFAAMIGAPIPPPLHWRLRLSFPFSNFQNSLDIIEVRRFRPQVPRSCPSSPRGSWWRRQLTGHNPRNFSILNAFQTPPSLRFCVRPTFYFMEPGLQ